MTPHDRRAARAYKQALDRAIGILKRKPQFPAAQVQIIDRTKQLLEGLTVEEQQWGTSARLSVVLRQLDVRASAYLELVDDMASQEAFMTVLNEFGRQSWAEYTGYPPEVLEPVPGNQQFRAIQQRVGHWLGEGYRRLVPASSDDLSPGKPSTAASLTARRPLDSARRPQLGVDILTHAFQVAFSFPGEARHRIGPIADKVQGALGAGGVFYDEWYKAELARPNLDVHLQRIYARAELVIVCLCAEYERKEWCGIEWRAVRDLMKSREDRVMLLRLDDADVPGSLSIDVYIDLRTHNDTEVGALIVQRVTGAQTHIPARHISLQGGPLNKVDVSGNTRENWKAATKTPIIQTTQPNQDIGPRLPLRVEFRDHVLCAIELTASVQVLPQSAPGFVVRFGDYATGVAHASNIIESCALAELERHSSSEARKERATIAKRIEAAARPKVDGIGFTLHNVTLRTITVC